MALGSRHGVRNLVRGVCRLGNLAQLFRSEGRRFPELLGRLQASSGRYAGPGLRPRRKRSGPAQDRRPGRPASIRLPAAIPAGHRWIRVQALLGRVRDVVSVGSALYLAACRRFAAFPYSAAQPTVFVNAVSGQNGFLSTAALLGGMSLLARRPFVAGPVLGLLSLKPQLALLLPVALLAGREWRAIAGGIVSFVALTLLAVIALGWGTYAAFFAFAPYFTQTFATGGGPITSLQARLRRCAISASPPGRRSPSTWR